MEFDASLFEFASKRERNRNYELAVWELGNMTFHSNCIREIMFEEPDIRSWNYPIFSSGKYNKNILRFLHNRFLNLFLAAESSDTSVQFLGKSHNPVILEMITVFCGIVRGKPLGRVRRAVAMAHLLKEEAESKANQSGDH